MSNKQNLNGNIIGEICVEGEAPPQYYQAFLDAQAAAEAAADRAEHAAGQIVVDQEFIETQVFSAGQASEIAAAAARNAAQSEKNTKDDADRAAGAADDAAAALARTEEVADSVGSPVSYKPQTLSKGAQAQVMENIGASTFYHTKREELGVAHEDINTEYIYGLYDALMAQYPGNVQKIPYTNDDGSFTNYAYVISTGDYTDKGLYQLRDGCDVIKKPKFLVMSGIDGHERKTVFSTYRFVRDLLRGHNVPQSFKEGAILHVMPVGCPWGFDKYVNHNENSCYIERNFDCEWEPKDDGTRGESAASENETKAIQKWLDDNKGADLFISYHNSGALNELVSIMGDSGNNATDMAKKIALRGVDRVIPYWRDAYPPKFKDVDYFDENYVWQRGERDTIFSYSASKRYPGTSILYAQEKCDIPSFFVETPSYYGTSAEWDQSEQDIKEGKEVFYQPEPIAAGAEAIGNILIGFYEQAFLSEVNDMNEVNEKLDALLQSATFQVVKGTYTPSANESAVTIPGIPANAKNVEIRAVSTLSAATSSVIPVQFGAFTATPSKGPGDTLAGNRKAMWIEYYAYGKWAGSTYIANNDAGLSFTMDALLVFEGSKTYEWTAYCWDD